MPLLFSYGTLQQDNVQLATFGRLLRGDRDELVGFDQRLVKIQASADHYERLGGYKRIAAVLASGKQAWLYVYGAERPDGL